MSHSGKDKELKSDTESEVIETTESEPKPDDGVKSSSTSSSSTNEEGEKKCMDAVDFIARQAKGIVIKKQGTETDKGKGKAPATAAAGKRRKRASGGIKRSISLRSGLNELAYSVSSDDEPAKGKGNEKETDVFSDLGSDTEKACKRIKKNRNNDDYSDDNDGGADGAGTGAGACAGLSIQA